MLMSYPDLFRTYADRICSIEWVDASRVHCVGRARDAAGHRSCGLHGCGARGVSRGGLPCQRRAHLGNSKHPTETNIVFMLDTLELYTIKRRMRAAQAKLRQNRSLDDEARRVLTMQAMQDSQRQRELQSRLVA